MITTIGWASTKWRGITRPTITAAAERAVMPYLPGRRTRAPWTTLPRAYAGGTPPRLRVGLFRHGTYSNYDDRDADYDGQVLFHEYAHGVSTRLVGGGTSTSCLGRIQSGALGEGWSDYYAASFFNNPVLGAYTGWNTSRGIRRQSYEGYTFTYADIGNTGYEVHADGEIWRRRCGISATPSARQ